MKDKEEQFVYNLIKDLAEKGFSFKEAKEIMRRVIIKLKELEIENSKEKEQHEKRS